MTTEPSRADEQRAAWIQHGLGELIMWLDHSTKKIAFIESEKLQGRSRHIEQAELVFAISAVLNRLAQIDLKTAENINIASKLIPWLARLTRWPDLVAEVFWSCLRSPTVHMGHAFAMADYGVRTPAGLPVLASLDLSPRRDTDPYPGLDFPPGPGPGHSHGDGWIAVHHPFFGDPPYDAWSGEHIGVTFQVHGVLDVVRSVMKQVAQNLRDASPAELDRLSKLNRRLPFISSPELDPLLTPPPTKH